MIARKLKTSPGPLPSSAQVVLFSCGVAGTYNGGTELLKAVAKKMHSTVYGCQSWGVGSTDLFNGKTNAATTTLPPGHNPIVFQGAIQSMGKWTKAYQYGSTQVVQTIYSTYFDCFRKIIIHNK